MKVWRIGFDRRLKEATGKRLIAGSGDGPRSWNIEAGDQRYQQETLGW